jgi:hypothetical protein
MLRLAEVRAVMALWMSAPPALCGKIAPAVDRVA